MRLRRTLVLALTLATLPGARAALDAAPFAAAPVAAGENGVVCPPDWVVICHTRPRNPVRQHTESIPPWALPWHLRHGDTLGACGAANQPPLADAGPDQTAPVAATATLDGSGSTDGDGDALTFLWTFLAQPAGSAASLSDPAAVNPTFVVDEPGTYVLQLVVHDGEAASPPDTMQVSTVNSPPVADAGADASVPFGQTATLDGSGSSDVDGDTLTFQWTIVSRPPGSLAALSDPAAVGPTFHVDQPGTFAVALVVNDGTLDSAPDTVLVETANAMPRADAGPDQAATSGDTVALDGSGSADPEGAPLTFSWSFVSRPAGSAAVLSDAAAVDPTFVVDMPGAYVVQLVVGDGELPSTPDTVLVTVEGSVVTVVASDENAAEAALDPGAFTVTRSGPTAGALTVFFVVTGSAQSGTDFETTGTEVTIPAGELASTVTLTPIDDSLIEGAESAVLVLVGDPAYTVGTPGLASLTIADDDVAVVTIVATDPDASEAGPATGTFTFTRTGGTADPLVVSFTRSGTATGGNTGALDYAPIGTLVTIPAGASSADVVLTPLADNRTEGPETATLTISPGRNIVVGTPDTATVTISDDPPVVNVVASDPDAAEAGADPGVFTFQRAGGNLAAALTVRSSFSGTAANAGDFVFISGLVTIPAGETSATLTIVPLADNRVEGAETMIVTIVPATGVDSYVIGTPDAATVTIADDPPVASVTATDASAAEAGADPGVFTFTRTGGDTGAALNLLVSRSGTASNGGDYAAIGGGTFLVVIPAGQASATVTIAPVDDALVEGEETVVLTLQPSTGYAIGSPGAATVTIEDDD